MTDTPPRPDTGPPGEGPDEKATLLAFLDYLRDAVAAKARGLDDARGRTAAVPSGTSLYGLVRHLTAAERYWFVWAFEGADVPHPDLSMRLGPDDGEENLLAAYREAVARSNEIAGACADLSAPCARPAGKDGVVRSMRWVLVHMIEETARHAGHADIIRERLDGAVGR
ncbi:DinB family protein [Streptomyces sp. NPDC007863]|uniref:DinB family protein n=1 Tax=Streptomyces sp. NPDC007863 TaxID=3154894 RepID=UPI0033D228BF